MAVQRGRASMVSMNPENAPETEPPSVVIARSHR